MRFMAERFLNYLNCISNRDKKGDGKTRSFDSHRNRRLTLEVMEHRRMLSIGSSIPVNLDLELAAEIGVLGSSTNSDSSSWIDYGDSYWADGAQISLWRSNNEMVVKLKASENVDSLMADLSNNGGDLSNLIIDKTLDDKLIVLSSNSGPLNNIDTTLANLASLSEVEWSSPAFINSQTNGLQYVTDEVVVQLQSGLDPQTFFTTDTFISYRPLLASYNQYIGSMASGGALATLSEANVLRSDSRVDWASPNSFSEFHYNFDPNDPLYTNGSQWNLNGTLISNKRGQNYFLLTV